MSKKYVTIHVKSESANSLMPLGILVAYINSDDRASLFRMLEHRRVNHINVATRECSDEEYDEQSSHTYRIGVSAIYDNWDKLIADEVKFGVNQDYIKRLEDLRVKFKQFNTQQLRIVEVQGE